MKTKVLYHQAKPNVDCPDGIASAWVASKVFPNAEFQGCVYQGDLPDIEGADKIVIVDFSFPSQTLESWADKAQVVVIDHHKTALNDLKNLSARVLQEFDMSECGATLAWKYFFPNKEMPAFLTYVRNRDLWNFDLDYSEEIHEAISNLKYQSGSFDKRERAFTIFDMLAKLSSVELQIIFGSVGEKLLEPKRRRIKEIAALAKPAILEDKKILVVEIPEAESRLISDLCSYMYKNNPEYVYVVAYYEAATGLNLSFRSNKKGNNFDVSEVAKKLGGGGHQNAAGAVVSHLFPWQFCE